MKTNGLDCSCLHDLWVSNVHDLLVKSALCGYGCFEVDFKPLLQVT